MTRTANSIEEAVEAASERFWREIAERFPDIKTGDFPPEADLAWTEAAERAARIWVLGNLPYVEEGSRFKLTREVERYPHFTAPAGATGTVIEAENELVRLRMDVKLDGAEEWDNEIVWTNDDDPDGLSAVRVLLANARLHLLDIVATPVLKVHQCVDVDIEGNFVRVVHLLRADGSRAIKVHGLNCDLEGEEPGLYRLDKRRRP